MTRVVTTCTRRVFGMLCFPSSPARRQTRVLRGSRFELDGCSCGEPMTLFCFPHLQQSRVPTNTRCQAVPAELYTCNTSTIGNLGADVGESRFSHAHYAFSNALGTRSIFSLRECEQPKTISEDCETVHYVLGIDVEQSGSFAVAGDTPLTRHKARTVETHSRWRLNKRGYAITRSPRPRAKLNSGSGGCDTHRPFTQPPHTGCRLTYAL